MRALPILLLVLLASGCATAERRERQAFTTCPEARDGAWRFLDAPPTDANTMLSVAKPAPKTPHSLERVRLFWFGNDAGQVLLCRVLLDGYRVDEGCSSQQWTFSPGADGWTEDNTLEHIIVCG